uniref:Prolamin-like domain-containing protein n=1 Tax=Chenopodium quinoa TaxID=63459 RepID=A0A803NDA3_CHEQI
MSITRSSIGLMMLAICMVILMTNVYPTKAEILQFSLPPNSGISPDSDIVYAPTPSTNSALATCASRITLDCASEIIRNDDFFKVHFEVKCCRQLVEMGKACNDLIVDDLLAEFADTNTKRSIEMHQRSDYLWNKCLQVVNHI